MKVQVVNRRHNQIAWYVLDGVKFCWVTEPSLASELKAAEAFPLVAKLKGEQSMVIASDDEFSVV